VNSMWFTETQPDVSGHTKAQPDTHTTPPRHSCKIWLTTHSKAGIHPPAHTYLSTPNHLPHSPTWTHKPLGLQLARPLTQQVWCVSLHSVSVPQLRLASMGLLVNYDLVVCGSKWVSEWNAQVWTSKCVLVDEYQPWSVW
jgi:hypothetical protein